MKKELKGHAHWVNTLCVHTDYALRTGAFDESTGRKEFADEKALH
jgi:ribosome assembly protein 4